MSFSMFGPLATIDWECFDIANVPWHLPSIADYDGFVYKVQSDGGATLSDSDGEPEETCFYDTLELGSDDGGDRTYDKVMTSVDTWKLSTAATMSPTKTATVPTMRRCK